MIINKYPTDKNEYDEDSAEGKAESKLIAMLSIANKHIRRIHAILTNEVVEYKSQNGDVIGYTAQLDRETFRDLFNSSNGLAHDEEVYMKNQADYSKYKCPYSHLEKECGHELKGPEGYENTYGVWCECGFRGPVFYLDPEELRLKKKADNAALTGAPETKEK